MQLAPVVSAASVVAGKLQATFRPERVDRKLTRLSVIGPTGSQLQGVYLRVVDPSTIITSTARGDVNTYEPDSETIIPAGQPVYVVWSTGIGSAQATLWSETIEDDG